MTTIESSPDEVVVPTESGDESGAGGILVELAGWLTSTDHKRIGRLYVMLGVLGLIATIVLNIVISVERLDGTDAVLDENAWPQLFDAQRIGMVFGTLIPIAMGLCLAVVPLQLGARTLAFPRLAVGGMWMWFGGLVLNVLALANDGGSLGFDTDMVDLYYASIGLMAVGVTASAGALATSILTTRTPGMTMRRVPFFSWSALVYALAIILVMPVLVGTLTYLFVDHRYGSREAFGGNTGVLVWASWIVTQPATFLFAIPAVGVFADLLPSTFGKRTPARGVMFAGISLVGVAAFAGVTQQNIQSLPWPGSGVDLDDAGDKFRDLVPYALFNVLPLLGAAIVLLFGLFLAKPEKGARPRMTGAFAFAFLGFGMVLTGMLGNVLYAVDDLALQGTIFEEATLVYVVYGAVLALIGGLIHWSPKLHGISLSTGALLPLSLLGVLGVMLATFPHYIAGFLDQPAGFRYDDSDLQIWNVLVLIGHVLFGVTVLSFVVVAARAHHGSDDDESDDQPDGQTVEWLTTSPAPVDNFDELILVSSAEPVLDVQERQLEGSDA